MEQQMVDMSGYMLWGIGAVILLLAVVLFVKQFKICPNDKILVVYGSGSGDKEKGAKVVRGGGVFVIPFLQYFKFLPLSPISIDIDLKEALSSNSIRVEVPSQFTLVIDSKNESNLQNAVRCLLSLSPQEIIGNAENIIFGSLRSVISKMTIEELTSDREKFIQLVNDEVTVELNKIGLNVINVNIKDIKDSSGYIQAMGQKAAAEAINKAHIDVAEQTRLGAVGVQTAKTQEEISVAEQKANAEIGKSTASKTQTVRTAELKAETVQGQNQSRAVEIQSNSDLAIKEAEATKLADVARAQADKLVSIEQRLAEKARLEKEELPKAQIAKEQIEIAAEAKANETFLIAEGEAKALFAGLQAQADGEKALLNAKAEGYKAIVDSVGGDTKAAATLLMIEKVTELSATMAAAMSNIKIDKVTVWDSGSGGDGQSGVQGFVRNMIGVVPQAHELAKQCGIELPAFLGSTVLNEASKTERVLAEENSEVTKSS